MYPYWSVLTAPFRSWSLRWQMFIFICRQADSVRHRRIVQRDCSGQHQRVHRVLQHHLRQLHQMGPQRQRGE